MHAPRIGLVIPSEIRDLYFTELTTEEMAGRQKRSSAAMRYIEGRHVGKHQVELLGKRIASRLKLTGPWYKFLDRPADSNENELIADAIGEWADEDAIGAHVGYQHDFLCSDDMGKSASRALGDSIFTPANRAWLSSKLRIQFVTLNELAAKL
jgi:hypothetical protein